MRSGSDYESSMPHRLDGLLVAAALVLAGAIAWTSLGGGSHPASSPAPVAAPLPPAPVPELVRLHSSSTSFLPLCPRRDLHLKLAPGGTLVLRFAGGRCHLPALHLRTVERAATGRVVYRGPALRVESLSGNFAVRGTRRAELLGPCADGPLAVAVRGSGLHAAGTVRCGHGS